MKKVSTIINHYQEIIRSCDKDESVVFMFLEKLTSKDKSQLLIDLETEIDEEKLAEMVQLYCNGISANYIVNSKYFLSREFYVDNRVLIPRFETEEVVNKAIEVIKNHNITTVCDLCCGSGVIGISIALECDTHVYACDISSDALEVAKHNDKMYNTNVEFYQGDLLEPVYGKEIEMIIANPPYIENKGYVSKETLDNEPHLALFGGESGLDIYKRIAEQIKYFPMLKYLVLEIGYNQREAIYEIFDGKIEVIKDINNQDRIVVVDLGRKD